VIAAAGSREAALYDDVRSRKRTRLSCSWAKLLQEDSTSSVSSSSEGSTGTGDAIEYPVDSSEEDVTATGSMVIKTSTKAKAAKKYQKSAPPPKDDSSSSDGEEIDYGTMVVADDPSGSGDYTSTAKKPSKESASYVPQFAQLLDSKVRTTELCC